MANFITMLRVAVTPGFVVLMVLSNSHPNLKYAAFGLFFFGALTDWADGFVARRTDSVTEFGKTADPLADRLFIGATLITLYAMRILPLPFLVLVLGRDLVMAAGYPIIGKIDPTKIAVHWTGKVATAVLFLSLGLLTLSPAPHAGSYFSFAGYPFTCWVNWQTAGLWLFAVGIIWSLISGGIYISRALELAREMKEGNGPVVEGTTGV